MVGSVREEGAEQGVLKSERHMLVLDRLEEEGKVLAVDLSASLGVSEDTVRRDLRELAAAGKLQRVHGGALPRPPIPVSYTGRLEHEPEAKSEIAKVATDLVEDGQVVFLDAGTTTLEVARRLPEGLRATVVTNSPPIALALAEHPGVEVIVVGGRLHKESVVAVGAEAVETIRSFRADLCLLGVCGLHPEEGLTTPVYEEVAVKRVMIACASEVAALVSAEKLDTAFPYVVAPLPSVTYLVTDSSVPAESLDAYRQLSVTVLRA
ncbi:MAG: hypothetical protein QOI57_1796 [Rubrobacteraceae bacterium]|nr:hypothetical protein [Rubrobacteraceae bacterium]